MESKNIIDKIKGIVIELSKVINFEEDDDIFDKGMIDSLNTIVLIYKLEKEFNIEIKQNEIKRDNLSSLSNMAKFINNKIQDN